MQDLHSRVKLAAHCWKTNRPAFWGVGESLGWSAPKKRERTILLNEPKVANMTSQESRLAVLTFDSGRIVKLGGHQGPVTST